MTKTRMKLLYVLILGWQIMNAQSQGRSARLVIVMIITLRANV